MAINKITKIWDSENPFSWGTKDESQHFSGSCFVRRIGFICRNLPQETRFRRNQVPPESLDLPACSPPGLDPACLGLNSESRRGVMPLGSDLAGDFFSEEFRCGAGKQQQNFRAVWGENIESERDADGSREDSQLLTASRIFALWSIFFVGVCLPACPSSRCGCSPCRLPPCLWSLMCFLDWSHYLMFVGSGPFRGPLAFNNLTLITWRVCVRLLLIFAGISVTETQSRIACSCFMNSFHCSAFLCLGFIKRRTFKRR